jgi:two-component system invasion response regulator UvrY
MSSEEAIRVMIVDDHAIFREGIKRVFSESGDIVVTQEAGSLREFRELIESGVCDVVLLDLKLADGNALGLIGEIKRASGDVKVVVLSALDHVRYVIQALHEGADGYVAKGAEFSELANAVKKVANGDRYICSSLSPRLAERLSQRSMGEGLDMLSEREFRVLVLSASGLSLKEIGGDLGISDKTVSTYRSRIMSKLGLRSSADLVRYAIEQGLVD